MIRVTPNVVCGLKEAYICGLHREKAVFMVAHKDSRGASVPIFKIPATYYVYLR